MTAVVFSLKPLYSSTAEVVLDTRVLHLDNFEVISGPLTIQDPVPIIRSEAERLRSTSLAGEVVDSLRLAQTEEFHGQPGILATLKQSVMGWLPWLAAGQDQPDPQRDRTALIEAYLKHLTVDNDGRSVTMKVMFWAHDPYLAARMANAHVRRYVEEQHALKQSAAGRALDLLGGQVQRLQADLAAKEHQVREFREQHGLVLAQGSTVVAHQIARVSDELGRALAELAQQKARMAEAQATVASGKGAQSAVLQSQAIHDLRRQEAEASRLLAGMRSKYDSRSPVLNLAEAQLADVRQNIAAETSRIVQSMRNDADIAEERVRKLSQELSGLQAQLVAQDKAEGQLTDMERDLSAERDVYRTVLARQQQIEAQAGGETSDARVVSEALVAKGPYFPRKTLLLPFCLGLSTVCAVGIAAAVDRRRTGIAAPEDLSSLGSIPCMQFVPLVKRGALRGRSVPDYMLDVPIGELADAIRALRGDIMHFIGSDGSRVIAITSALPGEGKTTVALMLARSVAALGSRVLLIDCDLRKSNVARLVGSTGAGGLVAALQDQASLEAVTVRDSRSTVHVLSVERQVTAPQDLLASTSLKRLLETARQSYDFVIVDTPPEGAVSDVFLIAPHVDATILLARWKTTPIQAVTNTLLAFETRGLSLNGIVLNAVDLEEYVRLSGQGRVYRSIRAYHKERSTKLLAN
jgi:capsular exopolysaccharide synthesis family protein